ncbi:MAG: cation:proton antiporter [Bacteroidetes bacterium]|nr:cation:proton antiporter [Bacteroidota bacterium]
MPIISHSMPFVVELLLLLLVARMFGEIMERFNQPAMIGEVLAGFILGPSLLGFAVYTNELKVISDLGVFLLVILAGFEIDIEDLGKSIRGRNAWIALLGFIIPMISGTIIGIIFHLQIQLTIFLSLCISITALPVSIRILMDLGKLKSDIGQKIISAAIFNDVISLLVLGVILDFKDGISNYSDLGFKILSTVIKVLGFMIIMIVAYRLFKKAKDKVSFLNNQFENFLNFLKGKESLFAVVMVFVLIFASLSELVGLHFVIGAFFGAILLPREMVGQENFQKVQQNTSSITMGFLAPIFFTTMGVQFNLLSINNINLLIIVIIASFISKIFGGYFGGRMARMSRQESFTLGIGLNARGIMELVIANIALQNGFIDISLFSILVIMGIITTVVTPFLLKRSFQLIDNKKTPTES